MKVVGVIDLLGGRAVHARAGARERYQPVVKTTGRPIPPGDSLALARSYVNEIGVTEIYVADLDAITGGEPQDALVARLALLGAPLWVDAGIAGAAQAGRVLALGISQVVVGLETLPSYRALEEICSAVGGDRVAFSLDVRQGEPILHPGGAIADPVETIAAHAAGLGAGTIIVLDLARVGTGIGPDIELMARLRGAAPRVTLMAGGGVRDADDVDRLAEVGCNGALVASALLSGRLTLPFRRT